MPDAPTMHMHPSDIRRFSGATLRMVRDLGYSNERAVREAAIAFARSGRAATKVGKKKRDLVPNPDHQPGRGRRPARGAKYLIVVKHQTRSDTHIATNARSDRRRIIRMRGAAKNSWAGVMRNLGKSAATVGGGHGRRQGFAIVRADKWSPSIELVNLTGYLLDVHPDLPQTAMAKATRAMHRRMDRIQRKWGAAWR